MPHRHCALALGLVTILAAPALAEPVPTFAGSTHPTGMSGTNFPDTLRQGASNLNVSGYTMNYQQGLTDRFEIGAGIGYQVTGVSGKYLLVDTSNLGLSLHVNAGSLNANPSTPW